MQELRKSYPLYLAVHFAVDGNPLLASPGHVNAYVKFEVTEDSLERRKKSAHGNDDRCILMQKLNWASKQKSESQSMHSHGNGRDHKLLPLIVCLTMPWQHQMRSRPLKVMFGKAL